MAAVPPGKTPISYLQELCTKRGITPQYDLVANEGAVHEPTFIMRVTVGEISANGKGSSKKKAKHNAAQAALNQVLGVANGQAGAGGDAVVNNITPSPGAVEGDGVGNPVGELQELTQKKLMKPPIYEFTSEQGPPHQKEFVCIVKLGKIQETGSARSKKTAKRIAAQNMLNHIKGLVEEGGNAVIEEEEDDDIPLKFYQTVMKKSSKQLKNLQGKPLNAPATNYCQMLQEIAEAQRFEVLYTDIPELSAYGMHQCLVQLSTMPVAVCHGTGPTVDEAHANAAHHSLQYLKLMTKT
ncbi:RISC-loading complex subunit tarbp2-like isoform X2 [Ruditapes philippinarum]|uniref:RISC-loading complex subunit tarbp2-like isoform X2 n=1 Tax=Ruditapes philippinarum TaxID=129788 RepID=UPI00295BA764|nr:RISC-loading complex subunit tarbp2-like isoform X2 [Ruditapes philippinarum]